MILAHEIVTRSEVWSAWSVDPGVLLALAVAGGVYGRGAARLRRRRLRSFGDRRIAAFYGGLVAVAVALLSPLDALGSTLFTAHMVQHLLLMVVAAPLIALGRPGLVLLHALPLRGRRALRATWARPLRAGAAALVNPGLVWGLGVVALWAWHFPTLYEAALDNDVVHGAEHASFLGTALLFWVVVLSAGARRGLAPPLAVMLVLATALQGAALGAILSFANRALYDAHVAGAGAWGVSPVEDQALAGVLMWVPPGFLYLVTMAVLLVRWFKQMDMAAPAHVPLPVEQP